MGRSDLRPPSVSGGRRVPGALYAQHQPVELRHQQVGGQHGEAETIGVEPEFANQFGQRTDGDGPASLLNELLACEDAMRSCDDGYPSCRHAEAKGEWCNDICLAAARKELAQLEKKLETAWAKQISGYDNGTATRRRTTTFNANAAWMSERISWLKKQIAQANS